VVKIDVEGAELDVLSGASGMLRISRLTFFLEAHGSALEKACSQRLSQSGYEVRRIDTEIRDEDAARHLVCLP
jgi:hypothetical protein